MNDLVRCINCGWTHFQVDNAHISNWKVTWDKYWPTLDSEGRDSFGLPSGPPTPEQYYHCFRCGGDYKNMRDWTDKDDIGMGHTIQPILRRDQEKNTDWDNAKDNNS